MQPMEKLLTMPQVCEILHISKRTLYRMRDSGEIKHLKIRGATRFTRQAVQDVIDGGGVNDPNLKHWKHYESSQIGEVLEAFERVLLDGTSANTEDTNQSNTLGQNSV